MSDPASLHSGPYQRALGLARFAAGDHAAAAAALERAAALAPLDYTARELLISAYGHLGRIEQAARVEAELGGRLEADAGRPYSLQTAEYESTAMLPGDRARLLDGLRLAGVRE